MTLVGIVIETSDAHDWKADAANSGDCDNINGTKIVIMIIMMLPISVTLLSSTTLDWQQPVAPGLEHT